MRALTLFAGVALLSCLSCSSNKDPHDVYPAPHPLLPGLVYGGGRVLTTPSQLTVTFQGTDAGVVSYLSSFGEGILTSSWWTTVMDGYGVGPGTARTAVTLPDTFSGVTVGDPELQTYIQNQLSSGALPYYDDSTAYVLYMPRAATIEVDGNVSCVGFGGYHSSFDATVNGATEHVLYAVIAECSSDGTPANVESGATVCASHELAEIATDPDVGSSTPDAPFGYQMIGNDAWAGDGTEIADLCADLPPVTQGSWQVQRIWNANAAIANHAPCQPDTQTFFGAAIHTDPGVSAFVALDASVDASLDEDAAAPSAEGYIVVPSGTTRSIDIDLFSAAALPGTLQVFAGTTPVAGQIIDNPTAVAPIDPGVDLALSPDSGTNGDTIHMTITVAPTVSSLVRRFTVRAVLSPTRWYLWKAVLYVP